MSKPADGGPAFPIYGSDNATGDGMRLRDWFAGQALAGILSGLPVGSEVPDPWLARECYRAADAMLRERLNKPEAST
jgi:hypothetical protein